MIQLIKIKQKNTKIPYYGSRINDSTPTVQTHIADKQTMKA